MQAVYVKSLEIVHYAHSSAITGGAVLVVNGQVLVAVRDFAANELGAYYATGELEFVKDNSNITTMFTALYWDADGSPVGGTALSGAATSTSSGNTFIGYTTETAGTTDGKVKAHLIKPPTSLTVSGSLMSTVTDPGASGAIPVTGSGYVALVSAGAETRTLAAPTIIGQELLIYMKTDGGDITLTCATTLNEAGNNTAVFGDTGDAIRMIAVEEGANKRWRITSVDGVTLSTV